MDIRWSWFLPGIMRIMRGCLYPRLLPSPILQTCPDGIKHRAIMLNSDTNGDSSINHGSCLHSALPRDVIDGFYRQPDDLQLIHASTFHGPFRCCRQEPKDRRSRTTVPAEYIKRGSFRMTEQLALLLKYLSIPFEYSPKHQPEL
jgi:hypothetical protein